MYTVLECKNCKKKVMLLSNAADGYRCKQCESSILMPIDKGPRRSMEEKYHITADKHKKNKVETTTNFDMAELERIVIGARVYDMFDFSNMNNRIRSDKDSIIILEQDIIKMWEMINPGWTGKVKVRVETKDPRSK